MVATAVTQLGRLPSLAAAFTDRTVTWAQVRTRLAVARLSDTQAGVVDDELAPLLDRQATRDPAELAVIIATAPRTALLRRDRGGCARSSSG